MLSQSWRALANAKKEMKNNIDFKNANYNVREDIKTFTMGELMSEDNAEKLAEFKKIGKNKGIGYFFRAGEEIIFPKKEEAKIFVEDFEVVNGTVQLMLSVSAYHERYGYFPFPLSITRRRPIDEAVDNQTATDLELLLQNNPVGTKLIMQQPDWDRMLYLLGHTVEIAEVCKLHQPTFDRDASGNLHPNLERLRTLTCYKMNFK